LSAIYPSWCLVLASRAVICPRFCMLVRRLVDMALSWVRPERFSTPVSTLTLPSKPGPRRCVTLSWSGLHNLLRASC